MHKIFNNFVKQVDLFTSSEYNNSVIAKPQNSNNSVKECFYGTIDIEQTARMEEFTLSQAADSEGCASGGKDLDSERVRQTLL